MGAELVLMYNDEEVANVGRTHNYYSDILLDMKDSDSAYNNVNAEMDESKNQFIKEMLLSIMALNPKNIKEMDEAIGDLVELYEDQCERAGRTKAIIDSIDNYSDLKLILSV